MSIRFARRPLPARPHGHARAGFPIEEFVQIPNAPLDVSDNRPIELAPQLQPTLPTAVHGIFARLGTREITRRFWHFTPGLLPILFWFVPHRDPIRWPQLMVISSLAVLGTACGLYWSKSFSRAGENECVTCALGYGGVALLALLLFPGQPEIAVTVLATLAFGDGSATLGGLVFRGPKLPWNSQKSWSGSLCFVLVALPIASLYYWAEARPFVSLGEALACAGSAVFAGVIAESMPSRINDNIRVPLAALAAMVVLHISLLGWQ